MRLPFVFFRSFLITRRTTISGDVSTEHNGRIQGFVNGNVRVGGNLVVHTGAVINGDVYASNVWIKGKVRGNVHCQQKVYADKNAEVTGHIYAREAVIDKESKILGGIAQLHQAKTDNVADNQQADEAARQKVTLVIEEKPPTSDLPQNWF